MANSSPSLALTLEPLTALKTPIIDVRPVQEFITGHLPFSTNIPLPDLIESWHELPPKRITLKVLANEQQLENLRTIFEQQDYSIESIKTPAEVNSKDWQAGNISQRLWKANPLLERHIDLILNIIDSEEPLVFDVGCGSGRDSVFLNLHGFKSLAIDNNQHALKRLEKFKSRTQAKITAISLDLQNQKKELTDLITTEKPQLIIQARYLHRPLLEVYKNSLPSGSIVAIHTFTQEAASFGKPKNPAYLLQDNELEEKYSEWNILLNQEHRLADGRPLSMFLGQKP